MCTRLNGVRLSIFPLNTLFMNEPPLTTTSSRPVISWSSVSSAVMTSSKTC